MHSFAFEFFILSHDVHVVIMTLSKLVIMTCTGTGEAQRARGRGRSLCCSSGSCIGGMS